MPTDSALSPTQCARSHLELTVCLLTLEPTRITPPVYTEIEVTHGTTQVLSHRVLTTT